MNTLTIQPANTKTGDYDVRKPLPYPYHVDVETGDVLRQDFWRGEPVRLLGFQRELDVKTLDVTVQEAAGDPESVVGLFAIMLDADGGMWTHAYPLI